MPNSRKNKKRKSHINKKKIKIFSHGFTIVEIIIVIVIIAVLAALAIVVYIGITSKAREAALISDLETSSKQLKLYQTEYNAYPTELTSDGNYCPVLPVEDSDRCLKSSPGNSLEYWASNNISPQTFRLTATNSGIAFHINNGEEPAPNITRPSDNGNVFIVVPGSSTYGTNDFCIMKYEAKNVAGKAVSQASDNPWVSIAQTGSGGAIEVSSSACDGCHLITEAEWMTIAQNILLVPSNWSSGIVGNGYIFTGHSDNNPGNSLAANFDSDLGLTCTDITGYCGTRNSTPSIQRRTLTLSNGEVIWDFAGNVWEWTQTSLRGGEPGIIGGGLAVREWPIVTYNGNNLVTNPFPSSTGISGAGNWTSANGIGKLMSNSDRSTETYGFLRGGYWNPTSSPAGVLSLYINFYSTSAPSIAGFRVAK